MSRRRHESDSDDDGSDGEYDAGYDVTLSDDASIRLFMQKYMWPWAK